MQMLLASAAARLEMAGESMGTGVRAVLRKTRTGGGRIVDLA
jgi:hypothetical protein